MVKKTETDISRFHRSYFITSCGCWIWLKSTPIKGSNGHGYGRFWFGSMSNNTRNSSVATRWIYQYIHKGIPSGKIICHKCDIPECVNPDHLFLGTVKENAIDMVKKGRAPDGITRKDGLPKNILRGNNHPIHKHPENVKRGEKHGMAKFSIDDIIKIREMFPKQAINIIAEEFKASPQHIRAIIQRKIWKHV